MKYNDNGTYKDIYVKTYDTLPVGAEVDYIGDTVPTGWTQVADYSTSEVDTGKIWIDGKKIYRKVVNDTLGTTNGSWKDISAFSANYIDTVVNFFGYFIYGNANKTVVPIPYTRITGSSYADREYILATINPVPGVIGVIGYHPSNYSALVSGQKVQFIIEYTKA